MPYREEIPKDRGIDNSIKLLLEGYQYISNRREKFGRDIFETRVLGGQKAICIAGEEAVKTFYDTKKITRKGAAPKRIRQTLFGEQAIQTVDGEPHRHRKELFMSLMTKERLQDITELFGQQLEQEMAEWSKKRNVILYEEIVHILTKVACEWTGIQLADEDVPKRANELEGIFDSAGAIGVRHWKGRTARNIVENWLRRLIREVRNGEIIAPKDTPLYIMAWYQDKDGKLLNEQIVAVELLNILRPIVAISVYITFIALALHEHPQEKEKLQMGGEEYTDYFVQEVRRFYPFFPMLMAKVSEDFLWNGHDFRKGNLVLLDIYGTNHHPDLWEEPYRFIPERFKKREENFYDFIPQGGGDYYRGHRCPGEWMTIELMKVATQCLIHTIDYQVPKQNLTYSMIRFPSLPKSRFVISDIKVIK
ncbi:cytochrome P450 [Ornithinibacillus halotolerans]|uniref:Cytochrome P450 n=1 Tax=Ornithinibacillus halotolerans TaxID=1274357 RepID=A0A916W8J5_9BACI|nr:cytochrome P450 [Ornithinibacillus halotolerans]GGA77929.1 cytochrome P450 [Ornithinibacillus halotolerans]